MNEIHSGAGLSEAEIIRHCFAVPELAFQRPGIELGIGDDAAVLRIPPGQNLIVSADVLVADVHFPADAAPELIAHRALAVNLSDLAAMGAAPLCFTLALTLPRADGDWLRGFARGLADLTGKYRCPLVGGDLSRGPLQIAIQVQGLCAPGQELRRGGAEPGQQLYVTGTVGDGALGLAALGLTGSASPGPGIELRAPPEELPDSCREHFHAAYFRPEPRIEFALAVAPLIAAAIDVSDGLFGDAGHLAAAAGVGIELRAQCLPFSAAAKCCADADSRIRAALGGGDDYELCFSADPSREAELAAIAAGMDLPLTRIGAVVSGTGVRCLGTAFAPESFDHFAARADG